MKNQRRHAHPGEMLDELYIKPLNLNLQQLANRLSMTQHALLQLRAGLTSITSSIAGLLAEAFDTTPQLWLNLQHNYDLQKNER